MKYLITGGAGFIGSHLTEALLRDGHQVMVLDNLSTGCYQNIAHLEDEENLRVITASVTDESIVRECMREVELVFHLASAVGVSLVVEQPVQTIETIVLGTSNVLENCARYRRPVLITSTSEVYGKSDDVPFREGGDSVIGPPDRRRWCYAAAKALDEHLALAFWHQNRLPVVLTRLFNTVGPRQTGRYGMVIPRFIHQALRNEPITVYGDGSQTRCFCHVRDVVESLKRLLGPARTRGELYNVGSSEEITIRQLAEKIQQMTGSTSEIRFIPYEDVYGEGFEDMARRVPDTTKLTQAISYKPGYSLETTLADCIRYAEQVVKNPMPCE